MTATEHVILVNQEDQEIGIAEKIYAHQTGLCHRAFSIFIFNQHHRDQVLLQQRANCKYHAGGLWTNTCCSHPRPNETVLQAGERRLFEEMHLQCSLKSIGSFHYIAHFDNGLTENEIDHVLIGWTDKLAIEFNPTEVQAVRWVTLSDLKQEIAEHPERFTPWLEKALQLIDV